MNIEIKEATINDIDEIIQLKKDVWDKLENKEWYVIDGTDNNFLKQEIENNGLVLNAVCNNKIVGFLIYHKNLNEEQTIIKKLHYENKINQCIELSNGAVDSCFRGMHLYAKMALKGEEIIRERYNKKYILATVHPDNKASLKSLLQLDFQIICKTKMYGNLDRCIIQKDI